MCVTLDIKSLKSSGMQTVVVDYQIAENPNARFVIPGKCIFYPRQKIILISMNFLCGDIQIVCLHKLCSCYLRCNYDVAVIF